MSKKEVDGALYYAIVNRSITQTMQAIKDGANVNSTDTSGRIPLISVCDHPGSYELAKLLIESGARVNVKEKDGNTPLTYAAMYGNLKLVELLLQAGGDPNMKGGNYGRTPLHFTASAGGWSEEYPQIVSLLLSNNADPNILNSGNESPLYEAIISDYSNMEIIKLLVEAGSNLETEVSFGSNALFAAISTENVELIE
jgi:uncharacterized protein